jgi:glycosyltransferase involved in cell wall biosynthesis
LSYISVSRHVAESCARNYGTHLAGDIGGNGVDGIDFSPRINDFNLRGTVCAIYRGVWFKNDLFPLQVMERVRQQRPDVKLAMAGFRRFSHAGVDTFLCNPTREEMALFYSGADFYLSGSKIEGSPLPPLEAMACGCIPVVTPVGTDEYLEPGKNGLAVDGDDPRTAAEAILRVYADDGLRRSLIREGLRTARHRTPQRTAHFFEKLLLKIGGER